MPIPNPPPKSSPAMQVIVYDFSSSLKRHPEFISGSIMPEKPLFVTRNGC
jgi:hypothetical protein